MSKPILIAVAYLFAVSPLMLSIAQSGYVLPAQLTPPSNWPFDPKARHDYNPFANFNCVKTYLTP